VSVVLLILLVCRTYCVGVTFFFVGVVREAPHPPSTLLVMSYEYLHY
jgi:hypothetical protein